MKKIRINLDSRDYEIAELKRKLEKAENRIQTLQDSRMNLLNFFDGKMKKLNKELADSKEGLKQLDKTMNAMFIGLALKNGGRLEIPYYRPAYETDYEYICTRDEENGQYIYEVREKKNEQVQSEEG